MQRCRFTLKWRLCGYWLGMMALLICGSSVASYADHDSEGYSIAMRVAQDLQNKLHNECNLTLTQTELMRNAPAFAQLASILLFTKNDTMYQQQLAQVKCPLHAFAKAVAAPSIDKD